MATREPSPTWNLMFGAGERLANLSSLLAPLAAPATGMQIQTLDDLERLLGLREQRGLLVLDADRLSNDDVVFVRRFASRQRAFRIVLVGDDSTRRAVRELLRLDSARWIAWPPDVDDLRALVAPAALAHAEENARESCTLAHAQGVMAPGAMHDEIAQIEAILDLPLGGRAAHAQAPSSARTQPTSTTHAQAAALSAAADTTAAGAVEPATLATRPAPYFRDQVADLADIAQRIELTLDMARESSSDAVGPNQTPLDGLAEEVGRLVQFTRTLGYLVAPPAAGLQTFDVGELLEVLVAVVGEHGTDSPRIVFRRDGPLLVRSDRQLLGQAFDAFLCVARNAAGRGEIVSVEVENTTASDPSQGRVTIEFPAGVLQGADPALMIEPYALRRVLPAVGPNALAAAIGIVAGQGGRAELRPSARGRLTWHVVLPSRARPEPIAAASPVALSRKPAQDPFA